MRFSPRNYAQNIVLSTTKTDHCITDLPDSAVSKQVIYAHKPSISSSDCLIISLLRSSANNAKTYSSCPSPTMFFFTSCLQGYLTDTTNHMRVHSQYYDPIPFGGRTLPESFRQKRHRLLPWSTPNHRTEQQQFPNTLPWLHYLISPLLPSTKNLIDNHFKILLSDKFPAISVSVAEFLSCLEVEGKSL